MNPEIIDALNVVLSPTAILLIIIGTCLGLFFGVLPGLGGAVAIAILIPITFDIPTELALMMMVAAVGGTAFGGSISAILVNVPGTAPNAATLLDGHPMAKNGEAQTAIGASAVSSALGAIIGLVFFVILIPYLRSIIFLFGVAEIFAMSLFGIIVLGVVSRGSLVRGILGGTLGLFCAFIGASVVTGGYRYGLGTTYLYDGLPLVPLIIGLFAIAEIIKLLSENRNISDQATATGSTMKGIRSVFENKRLFSQSSIIGIIIGIVPAVGGTISTFIAYMMAIQSSEDKSKYGDGDVRGVIAPEAANDSKEGGAMVPTLAFGIPGSAVWAVMIGAFVLHGLQPGPQMMDQNISLIYMLVFALVISNVLTSVVGLLVAPQLSKVTRLDATFIFAGILPLAMFGAYAYRSQILDVILAAVIGILGFLMIKYEVSRVAFIIGFVLGPIVEQSFHQSLQVSDGSYSIFYTSPIVVALFVLLLLSLCWPLLKQRILSQEVSV